MPSFPYTPSGMDPPMSKNSTDPYNTGVIAGSNIGIPGPSTGGLTARARPDQPSLGPPAGPKPVAKNPGNGAQQPTTPVNIPNDPTTINKTPTANPDQTEISDALGSWVWSQWTTMMQDRIQTDQLLLRCLYARKGEYTPDELSAVQSGLTTASSLSAAKTYFPITGTKCRAGEAWIHDIFTGTEGRLWQLTPTPVPNVPDFVKELVVEQIKKEMMKYGPMLDNQSVRKRIKELRDIAMAYVKDAAKKGADRMSQKIQDQLDEGGFDEALDAFVSDVITFPYAVMKGPIVKNMKMLEWEGSTPVVKTVAALTVERVSPFDYYYSQYATSPQEGNLIELMHMTRAALHNCIGLPNFQDDKIRQVLQSYPTGFKVYTQITTQRQQLERNTLQNINMNELIDTFDFWGSVSGRLLKEWGMKGIDDTDASYEVNAWVVNGICMRAVMNPDPMKQRPYYVTSYEKVPGALVGRSVPVLMRSNQEIINSAYRALRRNMGLASGPFAEVDISRLGGAQAPEEIRPAMVKAVEPDLTGSGRPAYQFHDIQSHAQELQATIDAEIRKCDDITGIPAYSYGNAAVAGAGRTVGGLAMLMGNASKGIKKVISNIEQDVLEPLITGFFNYNMLYDTDSAIKVDAQIVAKGPTGVILKEASVQRNMEALQILGPFIPTGIIPKDGVANLLRQILSGLDLDVDRIIPDPEKAAELAAIAQQNQQVNGPPGGPQQVPQGAAPPPNGIAAPAPGGPPQVPAGGGSSSNGGKNGHPGIPPGVHPLLPHGLPPAAALNGTPITPPLDGRSGPAAAVVAGQMAGRM